MSDPVNAIVGPEAIGVLELPQDFLLKKDLIESNSFPDRILS